MAKKSRDPSKLSHDDLVTWSKDEVDWLADHAADPDLTPRAADFPVLSSAYEDAYNAEIEPEQSAPLLHKQLEDLDDVLIDVLRLLRVRIPLLPDVEEPKLAPFGLGDDVPTDWDKLVSVATVCREHWLDISGGGVPPEFAAVEVNMAAMLSASDTFITKHAAYRAAIGDKQDAVAYKNECRDALLECEREIFHWYRAAHPDGDDIWWRSTPWGTVSGEQEEPEVPLPDFPSICEIFKLSLLASGNMEVVWSGINGATHVVLEKRLEGEQDWILVIDGLPVNPDELAPFIDPYVTPGNWEYRITVYNGDEAGESKIATIEVPEV